MLYTQKGAKMALYVCGDLHTPNDIHKLNTTQFPEQKQMTKDDIVVNLGDFGGVWYHPAHPKANEDQYWRKWLKDKNFTFCFVDGNHENFDLLETYPIIEKWGGNVRDIDGIYQLLRGEVYTIQGKKILTIGGAESHDKSSRKEGISWWHQETVSYPEQENALNNLQKHNNTVDYVLTHTCPSSVAVSVASACDIQVFTSYCNSSIPHTEKFLEHIKEITEFKEWHFGHWHIEYNKDNFYCHYNNKPHKLF